MAALKRVRVLVSGRVQGVFFRRSAADLAGDLGLAGSARNLADGRVEVVFEGEPDAVEEAVAWCRTGPPHAQVEGVQVEAEPPEGGATFRIS